MNIKNRLQATGLILIVFSCSNLMANQSGVRTSAPVEELLFNFTSEAEHAKHSSRESLIKVEERLQAGIKSASQFSALLLLNSEMVSDAKSTKDMLARINALITKFNPSWMSEEKLIRNSERLRLQLERARSASARELAASATKQVFEADARLAEFRQRHPEPHHDTLIADYLERLKNISRELRTHLFGGRVLQTASGKQHPRSVRVQGWEADLSQTEARIQRQITQQQTPGHSRRD